MQISIQINGSNLFRASKGGGVAIYIKSRFNCTITKSISRPQLFEILSLDITLSITSLLTVIGCYRSPSASQEALDQLADLLADWQRLERLCWRGDLNWDWLSAGSDPLKRICTELNLTQIIPSPPNVKSPDRSTLIGVILTNAPHKYSATVFSSDISDHCTITCIRDTRLLKIKPCILKHFSRVSLIPDINIAWNYFHSLFLSVTNKHAPMICYRMKGRGNPWFSPELASDSWWKICLDFSKRTRRTVWLDTFQISEEQMYLLNKKMLIWYIYIYLFFFPQISFWQFN